MGKQLKKEREAIEKKHSQEAYLKSELKKSDKMEKRKTSKKARLQHNIMESEQKKNINATNQKIQFCSDTWIAYKGFDGETDDVTCAADCNASACTVEELHRDGWVIKTANPKELIIRKSTEVGGQKSRVSQTLCDLLHNCYQDKDGYFQWQIKPKYIGCKCTGNEFVLERDSSHGQ
ncbi:MAG: hypothetical protein WC539_02990 [Nitrospirota bacterium]